ncbi:unnamed protein product, partial [Ectocarpus sp. 6 AP-2014]
QSTEGVSQEHGDGGEKGKVTTISKPAVVSKGDGDGEENEVTVVSKPPKDSLVAPPRNPQHGRDGAAIADDDVVLTGSRG